MVYMPVVPLTLKLPRPVKVSAVPLPSTASPVMVKPKVAPATVPLVVIVVPARVVAAAKLTAPV